MKGKMQIFEKKRDLFSGVFLINQNKSFGYFEKHMTDITLIYASFSKYSSITTKTTFTTSEITVVTLIDKNPVQGRRNSSVQIDSGSTVS